MTNRILLVTCLLFSGLMSKAQEWSGFRTDNYNGVSGAFFNPANLANSPYKIDVNILGTNIFAGNKNQDFGFKTISNLGGDSTVIDGLIGNGKANSILVNLAVNMPSISVRINDKLTVAFLSRTRLLLDVHDFDGTLINSITAQTDQNGFPYSLNNVTNMRLNSNLFSEFGLSAGYTVFNEGNHFLKVGATIKYLGGVGNAYFQLNNLKATIDYYSVQDYAYASNASGSLAVGTGGADFSNNVNFNFSASGIGADLGIVYEYRPDDLQEEANPYLFKIGASILDLGSIKYKTNPKYTGAYSVNIPNGTRFDLSQLASDDTSQIKSVFDAYPQYFTATSGLNNKGSYAVALPRTLQLNGDIRAMRKVYIAANVQVAMSSNKTKPYNPSSINSLMITPRYERKMIAAYLPISINNLSGFNMGFGFRAGPLYAGSSSILSAAFTKSNQIDFYLGLRFGLKHKAKKEA